MENENQKEFEKALDEALDKVLFDKSSGETKLTLIGGLVCIGLLLGIFETLQNLNFKGDK